MLLKRRGPARVFALAFSLGLSELARGHLLTGFPWDVIGYGLVANEPLMQLSSVFGIDSLTVLAILLFAAPAAIWTGAAARSRSVLLLASSLLVLLGASYVWGGMRLAGTADAPGQFRVRIVQANVSQADKWNPRNAARIFEDYLDMTRRPGLDEADVVIWPGTALPFCSIHADALEAIAAAVLPA